MKKRSLGLVLGCALLLLAGAAGPGRMRRQELLEREAVEGSERESEDGSQEKISESLRPLPLPGSR